jgi:hypothetical protein
VVGTTLWRISTVSVVARRRRVPAAGAVLIVVLAMLVWTAVGPLQRGWARRAGTPVTLLASRRVAAAATGTSARVSTPALHVPFQARLDGMLSETAPDATGAKVVVIDGRLHEGAAGRVHVVLQGQALDGGGVAMDRSRAYLGTVAVPTLYAGAVTALQGTRIVVGLRSADGRRVDLELDLTISAGSNRVTGRADAQVAS